MKDFSLHNVSIHKKVYQNPLMNTFASKNIFEMIERKYNIFQEQNFFTFKVHLGHRFVKNINIEKKTPCILLNSPFDLYKST